MKNLITKFLNCNVLGSHDWTGNAIQGIKPTKWQLNNGIVGFQDYAKMYCKRCGIESKLNKML